MVNDTYFDQIYIALKNSYFFHVFAAFMKPKWGKIETKFPNSPKWVQNGGTFHIFYTSV